MFKKLEHFKNKVGKHPKEENSDEVRIKYR